MGCEAANYAEVYFNVMSITDRVVVSVEVCIKSKLCLMLSASAILLVYQVKVLGRVLLLYQHQNIEMIGRSEWIRLLSGQSVSMILRQ